MVAVHHFGFWPSTPWNKGADLSTRPSTPPVTLGSPPVSRAAAGRHVPVDRRQRMGESERQKKRPQGGAALRPFLARKRQAAGSAHSDYSKKRARRLFQSRRVAQIEGTAIRDIG
jgi:hypothetical protein